MAELRKKLHLKNGRTEQVIKAFSTIKEVGGSYIYAKIDGVQAYIPLVSTSDSRASVGRTNKATKKYYKYEPWIQPVLTGNATIHGTVTCNSFFNPGGYYDDRAAYHISDGKIPTSGDTRWNEWGTHDCAIGWVNWELPEEIIVKGIKVYNRVHFSAVDYELTGARFYTDSTKATPIGEEFSITTSGGTYTLTTVPKEGIKTKNIYFYKTGNTYSGLGEIVITATKTTYSEVDASSTYDFTTTLNSPTALAITSKPPYTEMFWNVSGTYTWTAPNDVTRVRVALVGGGAGACTIGVGYGDITHTSGSGGTSKFGSLISAAGATGNTVVIENRRHTCTIGVAGSPNGVQGTWSFDDYDTPQAGARGYNKAFTLSEGSQGLSDGTGSYGAGGYAYTGNHLDDYCVVASGSSGAYQTDYVTVTPGTTYTIVVGAGGRGFFYTPDTMGVSKDGQNGYVYIAFGGDI